MPPKTAPKLSRMDYEDIVYVCKQTLGSLQEKLKRADEVTRNMIIPLLLPEVIADEGMMVPIDLRGIEQEFDDIMQIINELGPKGVAEAYLKAKKYFDSNHDDEPERMRPKPMTAAEWRNEEALSVLVDEEDIGSAEDRGSSEEELEDSEKERCEWLRLFRSNM